MEKPRTSDQSKLIYYLSEKNSHLLEEIMDIKNSLKGVIMKQDEQVRQSKNSNINTEVTHKHVVNPDKIKIVEYNKSIEENAKSTHNNTKV